MVSTATPHLKLLDCSCVTALSRTRSYPFSLKTPCRSFNSRYTDFTFSSISLQSKFNVVPLVAQTSDWPQQEEKAELENEIDEGIQANATDSFSLEGKEENADSDGGEGEAEGSYAEYPEEAKLFVGNLHYDVDSEKLAQLFYQAGVVEISEVIYNRQTDQSRGFGFVTMSTVEEADKAVEMFNRYELNGRLLTVNKASPVGSQPERVPKLHEAAFRIYIGNLPWQVDNARLEQVFSEHGKVIDARVVYDRETGRSRGFGFVTMSTETEVNDAIAALDGKNLDGRAIRVNIAEERPRRSF